VGKGHPIRLSDHSINVRNAQVKTFEGQPAVIELGIEIRDRNQLEHIFTHIKNERHSQPTAPRSG